MDFNAFLAAAVAHKWVLLGALFIGAFVATAKQGWLGNAMQKQLPPRWIPFLAPIYAAMTVGSTEIIAGKTWQVSLSESWGALVAGVLAIVGHQLVIEGIRNGKELIPNKAERAAVRLAKGSP